MSQEKGRIMVHTQAITREVLEGFVRPTFAAGAVRHSNLMVFT